MIDPDLKARREYAAPALERGFDILELLAGSGASMTISEIALGLGRSMSEVFRIIIVMERRGWLRRDPQTDRFSVSYRMLDIAYRATPARALANVAAPVMQELAAATNQSCHLVVRAEGQGLVIQRQENAGPAGFAMRTGAIIDLATSCSGHVLLAFAADAGGEAAIAALKPGSPVAVASLAARFTTVRDQGFEMQPSARTAGVTDISVPVFGFDGTVAAALTVPYLILIDDSQTTDLERTRTLLIAAGEEVSVRLGARPTTDS